MSSKEQSVGNKISNVDSINESIYNKVVIIDPSCPNKMDWVGENHTNKYKKIGKNFI